MAEGAATFALTPSRMAGCPCGSAHRYKQCCGRLRHEWLASTADAEGQTAITNYAIEMMHRGEAARAADALARLSPEAVQRSDIALTAGEICIDLHELSVATAYLERAASLDPANAQIAAATAECRELLERPAAARAAYAAVRVRLERLRSAALPAAPSAQLHVVCKLDTLGGTERRALNLYRDLSRHIRVTLWSTVPASAAARAEAPIRLITAPDAPDGGALAIIGTYYECGPWLRASHFERVMICHNLAGQYRSLGQTLVQLEANPARPSVALTFPSHWFKQLTGLPGEVEYSTIDLDQFRPQSPPRRHAGSTLRIGRHGRSYPPKFHPNDPAFFRRLLASGYSVHILGGSVIAPAFAHDIGPHPRLLDQGAVAAATFLDSLDVFVYRKHPGLVETGGTVILEAMAMALPVVIFAEDCGCAELIRDGANGFLVSSEAEAFRCIERLRADPDLRERLGHAARATIVDLLHRQEAALVRRYLGA